MTRILPIQHQLDRLTYRGTAYIPENGAATHPTVVLHHGFGSTRLEAFGLFVQLSRALADEGIVAIAFDRAGHGESDGSFYDTTTSGDIEASKALLAMISDRPEVDDADIHVLGMSLGAVIAGIVASETDVPVASLTLLSPAAVFADELRKGTLQGHPTDVLEAIGYFDFNGSRLGPSFFTDARTFDVYGRSGGFAGPVRVIHGAADLFVPTEYVLRYQDVYGPRAEISLIPEGDHLWSSIPVRDQLLRDVIGFVRGQLNRSFGPPVC